MSTNDVPGFNPQNHDDLHAGCWAEHHDGSLIFVLGTENGTVLYDLYDLEDTQNPMQWRDAMPLKQFQKQFSYDPTLKSMSLKWTWHDKTAFPWDRIMKSFNQGVRPLSVEKQVADTAQVRKSA